MTIEYSKTEMSALSISIHLCYYSLPSSRTGDVRDKGKRFRVILTRQPINIIVLSGLDAIIVVPSSLSIVGGTLQNPLNHRHESGRPERRFLSTLSPARESIARQISFQTSRGVDDQGRYSRRNRNESVRVRPSTSAKLK